MPLTEGAPLMHHPFLASVARCPGTSQSPYPKPQCRFLPQLNEPQYGYLVPPSSSRASTHPETLSTQGSGETGDGRDSRRNAHGKKYSRLKSGENEREKKKSDERLREQRRIAREKRVEEEYDKLLRYEYENGDLARISSRAEVGDFGQGMMDEIMRECRERAEAAVRDEEEQVRNRPVADGNEEDIESPEADPDVLSSASPVDSSEGNEPIRTQKVRKGVERTTKAIEAGIKKEVMEGNGQQRPHESRQPSTSQRSVIMIEDESEDDDEAAQAHTSSARGGQPASSPLPHAASRDSRNRSDSQSPPLDSPFVSRQSDNNSNHIGVTVGQVPRKKEEKRKQKEATQADINQQRMISNQCEPSTSSVVRVARDGIDETSDDDDVKPPRSLLRNGLSKSSRHLSSTDSGQVDSNNAENSPELQEAFDLSSMTPEDLAARINIDTIEITPEHIRSNGSIHTSPFSAIAEIIDNSMDSEARKIEIDLVESVEKKQRYLQVKDDGEGMDLNETLKIILLGSSTKRGDNTTIGQFGNGLKSGAMRLGETLLVLTRKKDVYSILLISVHYMDYASTRKCYVPCISYKQLHDGSLRPVTLEHDHKQKHAACLKIITGFSPLKSENEIFEYLKENLTGTSGTCVLVSNMKTIDGNKFEVVHTRGGDLASRELVSADGKKEDEISLNYLAPYLSRLYLRCKATIMINGCQLHTVDPIRELADPQWTPLIIPEFVDRAKKIIESVRANIAAELKKLEPREKRLKIILSEKGTNKDLKMEKRMLDDEIARMKEQMSAIGSTLEMKAKADAEIKVHMGIDLATRATGRVHFYTNGRRVCTKELLANVSKKQLREASKSCLGVVTIVDIPSTLVRTAQNREDYELPSDVKTIMNRLRQFVKKYFNSIDDKYGSPEWWVHEFGYDDVYSVDDFADLHKYGKKIREIIGSRKQCGICHQFRDVPAPEHDFEGLDPKDAPFECTKTDGIRIGEKVCSPLSRKEVKDMNIAKLGTVRRKIQAAVAANARRSSRTNPDAGSLSDRQRNDGPSAAKNGSGSYPPDASVPPKIASTNTFPLPSLPSKSRSTRKNNRLRFDESESEEASDDSEIDDICEPASTTIPNVARAIRQSRDSNNSAKRRHSPLQSDSDDEDDDEMDEGSDASFPPASPSPPVKTARKQGTSPSSRKVIRRNAKDASPKSSPSAAKSTRTQSKKNGSKRARLQSSDSDSDDDNVVSRESRVKNEMKLTKENEQLFKRCEKMSKEDLLSVVSGLLLQRQEVDSNVEFLSTLCEDASSEQKEEICATLSSIGSNRVRPTISLCKVVEKMCKKMMN